MRISQRGIDLIKSFEGLYLEAYKCPAGVWTIGWGTTKGVTPGMKITKEKAEELLRGDLVKFEAAVERNVKVPINQNMFDSLVSFTYNLGEGNLKSSTLLKKLNAKDYYGTSQEFQRWNKAGGKVLNGLIRRREAERDLFNSYPA
ncbi:MAG: lysozyme [Cetobacterium sp.]